MTGKLKKSVLHSFRGMEAAGNKEWRCRESLKTDYTNALWLFRYAVRCHIKKKIFCFFLSHLGAAIVSLLNQRTTVRFQREQKKRKIKWDLVPPISKKFSEGFRIHICCRWKYLVYKLNGETNDSLTIFLFNRSYAKCGVYRKSMINK